MISDVNKNNYCNNVRKLIQGNKLLNLIVLNRTSVYSGLYSGLDSGVFSNIYLLNHHDISEEAPTM